MGTRFRHSIDEPQYTLWTLMPLWVVIAICVIASLARGDGIGGPSIVDPGKSAIIKIPIAEAGADFSWKVEPSGVNWISGENRQETFVILLDLDPGRYVVSFASFDAKQHSTHSIYVGGPSPPPMPPGPLPPPLPTPDPVEPETKYGLTKAARAWVMTSVDAIARPKAKALASSFRSIASAQAAGTISGLQQMLTMTRESNNAALGDSVSAWKPWGLKLNDELKRLTTGGKIASTADLAEAWLEIAAGLEGVK